MRKQYSHIRTSLVCVVFYKAQSSEACYLLYSQGSAEQKRCVYCVFGGLDYQSVHLLMFQLLPFPVKLLAQPDI